MTLEAFSEDHLKTLYFNPLLEQMEDFVEHFIKVWVKQTPVNFAVFLRVDCLWWYLNSW